MTIVTANGINQLKVNATYSTMFNINCNVESYPPAIFYWQEDGENVSNNSSVLVNTSIPGAVIMYTCVAVNVIRGSDHFTSNSINVIIQSKLIHGYMYMFTSYFKGNSMVLNSFKVVMYLGSWFVVTHVHV